MLDRLVQSPLVPVGFIAFVVVLLLVYLTNRERSHVQRMRGPSRFQPDWSRTRGPASRRRRRRRTARTGFKPDWGTPGGEPPGGSDPGSASPEKEDDSSPSAG